MKIYRSKACIIYRELKLSRDFVPTENLQIISKIPGFQKKIYRSKSLDLSLLYYTVNIDLIYRLQAILIKNIFRKKRSNTRGPGGGLPKLRGRVGGGRKRPVFIYAGPPVRVKPSRAAQISPVSHFYISGGYFIAQKSFARFWRVLEPLNENTLN